MNGVCIYAHLYDALGLVEAARAALHAQQQLTKQRLETDIEATRHKLSTQLTPVQKRYYENQKAQLTEQLASFNAQVAEWVELFTWVGGAKKKKVFGKADKPSPDEHQYIPYRLEIIRKLIKRISTFIPLHLMEDIPKATSCPYCTTPLVHVYKDETWVQHALTALLIGKRSVCRVRMDKSNMMVYAWTRVLLVCI